VASYRIAIKPSAAKEIENLQKADRTRVVARIQSLAGDPRPMGCEKLSGQDRYRLRQGSFRILYEVHDDQVVVVVVKVGDRKEVYR
jgi:mRNA interferase RelE/StbE